MNKTIPVEDLYLAGWLMSNDVVLQGHERRYGYSTFYFEGGPETDRLADEFNKNNAFKKYTTALRQLKSIMYARNDRPEPFNTTQHVKQTEGTN